MIESEIQLYSGGGFDLLRPDPEMIRSADLAHALGQLARFAGHGQRFYSVAEHSVHVSSLLPPPLALAGLLHDAHEAYTGDLTRPFKLALRARRPAAIEAVRSIQEGIDFAIARRFDLDFPWPAEVHQADQEMLAVERDQVMGGQRGVSWEELPDPPPVVIQFWSPERAEAEFRVKFAVLAWDRCDRVGQSRKLAAPGVPFTD